MSGQITPEQAQNLLTLAAAILLVVAMRLAGLAMWRKWFADDNADNGLTQEEKDDQRVQRRRHR